MLNLAAFIIPPPQAEACLHHHPVSGEKSVIEVASVLLYTRQEQITGAELYVMNYWFPMETDASEKRPYLEDVQSYHG
jgi:hypothetical protein